MDGFRALIELHAEQQHDLELGRRQEALRAQIEALRAEVVAARATVESADAELKRLQKDRRSAESDVEASEQVRKRYRTQLMEAKTNEVYKTLLHEIETIGRTIRDKEGVVLELMEAMETATTTLETGHVHVTASEAKAATEVRGLDADIVALEAEREACRRRAAALEAVVPRDLLSRFRRIGEQRGGKALARAVGHSCAECHVAVRPQVWVELLTRPGTHGCAGCGRILYRDDNLLQGPALSTPAPAPPEAARA
jgi:hypothetical protein